MLAVVSNMKSVSVPTLASVSPKYAQLAERRSDLWTKMEALRNERMALIEKLSGRRGGRIASTPAVPGENERERRIASLLGDPPAQPREVVKGDEDRLREITEELSLLDEACLNLDRRIRVEASAASALICELVKDRHAQLMNDLVEASLRLHAANVAFGHFADEMAANSISWSALNPVFPRFAGKPSAKHSELAQYFYEVIAAGWMSQGKLPREFR